MAPVAIATPSAVGIGNSIGRHLDNMTYVQSVLDTNEINDSAGSDVEVSLDSGANEQHIKIQAQRSAFDTYLKSFEVRHDVHKDTNGGAGDSAGSDASTRIIDQVRQYQQELFERALEENVIAVLDTGSGKTLIACLLIRHTLAEELINREQGKPAKIVCFFANSVHLVQQQARVLASNLVVKPAVFIGDLKAETWKNTETWSELLEKGIPVVCTPAVLLYCLGAALIRIDQISLMVFDEAHHAKKDHPYSLIIRSHFLSCDLNLRPRIFGMTASPVDSKGNIDTNVANLEELLHCKIITTDDPSKLSFVPKPRDVVWRYQRIHRKLPTELSAISSAKFHFLIDMKKGATFAREAVSVLGPWCADRVWRHVVGHSEIQAAGLIKRFERSAQYANLESPEDREIALGDLKQFVVLVAEHDQHPPSLGSLSSKVVRLYDELFSFFSSKPDTRAIVFVEQRFTAQVLSDCFEKLNIPNLRPAVLLGTAQDSGSLKQQEIFLEHFRIGLINLIFATSVAEEGIDIPQCNLCVRFDLYKSPIQYTQSRGRARMRNSIYAHMIEEGNSEHANEVSHAINTDKYITEYCQSLPPNRLLGRGTKLEKLIAQDSRKKSFKTKSGAICDFDNSLLVLSRFASSLHYLGAIGREVYEEEIDEVNKQFRYVVRLPVHDEIGVPGARGEYRPNKQLAKRSAAWNCCVLLRRKALLDENLNSVWRKIKPENLNARLAISEKKSAYKMIIKPSLWQQGLGEVPTELYVYRIHLEPCRPLRRDHSDILLLTRGKLPSIPAFLVYLEDNIEVKVIIGKVCEELSVSTAEVNLLTKFTLDGVYQDIFNKTYETSSGDLSYWLAPPSTHAAVQVSRLGDIVEMNALEAVQHERIKWSPEYQTESLWANRFICDPRNGKFHYFTGEVAPGVSIFDPVPSTVPAISQKSMNNIIDFSDSHWKASKKKFGKSIYDSNQPVLTADLVTARRNFLEPGSEKDRAVIKCLIAPQPLEVCRLGPSFAASCLVWPAIIHRLESYMISLEAFRTLELFDIPADLALEAFTKDNHSEDQEHQTHTGNRHGMGKNYERLEFIGDSLLKMMTTITVFNRTKCDEEGMHCRRMEILCNRRLFDVSTQKHHLYQYARTSGFNRATWYPENLLLLKGRGAKKVPEKVKHPEVSQDLGMKTIADISEAIIGAAVFSSRATVDRFDKGIKAITKLVDSEDHAITSWSEIAAMYEAPEWSLKTNDVQANKLAEDIAVRTGYHFRYPRLLRSAFTHSSELNATVPDLQRLEFLGDAVLDWVSIDWLFTTHPDRNPQWLTEHKMAMVSNKFLAALAVVLEFDKFIACSTAKLYTDIFIYAKRVRELYAEDNVNRDFWTNIDSPPKALSDLVESYLGAVLVDSGFNYDEVEKFFNKHVLWFFEDISQYDSFANRHPTTFLYKKLTNEFKCRDFNIMSSDTDDGMVQARVTAGVLIHNRVIADSSGASAKYAKVRASQKALAQMEGMSIDDFQKVFGCDCRLQNG